MVCGDDSENRSVSLYAFLEVVAVIVLGLEIAGLEGGKVHIHSFKGVELFLNVGQCSRLNGYIL